MKVILTVARREITRLRSRFSGKSRAIVFGVLALTIVSSLVMYHQDLVVSKGLYTIGASPESPIIEDSRFRVAEMSPSAGKKALEDGFIDLYLQGTVVYEGYGERAERAHVALSKYLQKQELLTIAGEYKIEEAFPLRIKVTYLGSAEEGMAAAAELPDETETGDVPVESPAMPAVDETESAAPEDIPASADVSDPREQVIAAITEDFENETYAPELAASPPVAAVDSSDTDDAVRQQLADFAGKGTLPEFKAEFVSENDIIIPSLMSPPIPLAQVIITFLYVVPVFFISLFFTSSFTEEKISRKLVILLSAPVTRLQVILGKMAPYLVYSILVIIGVTLALGGNVGLALAIFVPVMLFIFAIYLMVALTYRTFKDQTFFSVLALSIVTVYLVGPAMSTTSVTYPR